MKDIMLEIRSNPIMSSITSGLWPVPHLHKELEMIFVESGSVKAFADKKCYQLSDGDVFLAFPNQVHYYESSLDGIYYLIIFSPDTIFGAKNIMLDNVLRSSFIKKDVSESISQMIKQLPTISHDYSEPFKQTAQAGILNQIMATILKKCELKPRIKSDNATLQKILNYCEQNFSNDITLDSVSDTLHLNKYHISHLLNQKLGIGFNVYINALRISKACDLLEETDKKTSDISEEVGFGSIRSFNRAFMSIMNTTPLKYRSQTKTQTEKTDELIIGQ